MLQQFHREPANFQKLIATMSQQRFTLLGDRVLLMIFFGILGGFFLCAHGGAKMTFFENLIHWFLKIQCPCGFKAFFWYPVFLATFFERIFLLSNPLFFHGFFEACMKKSGPIEKTHNLGKSFYKKTIFFETCFATGFGDLES